MSAADYKKIMAEDEMTALGGKLALAISEGAFIYFHGNLGAGKTTFIRGMMRGLGYDDKVKSPTYTIVEPYDIGGQQIYHFDLYRLITPDELEQIGIADYFAPTAICLVEWPEKGSPLLPAPDLACYIETVDDKRALRLAAHTPRGETLLGRLNNA